MVAPAPDRTLIGKSANPTRESLPQVPDSLPQVKLKALVGTNPVTDQEVKEAVRMRLGEYRELQGSARLEKEKAIEREELRKIIERELIIDDMFSRLKKNKKNTEDIKELVAQSAEQSLRTIRNQQGARTEEEFIVMLRAQGLTIPILRRQIERQMMADEYVRGLLKDLGRTPGFAEIRAYYDQHPDKFKSEDRVRWQDIFISVNNFPNAAAARAHAEKVRQLAVEGTDFISLIKAQERTPSGRQNWDGIGTNRQTVPADVAPTVWALQPGQISAIIETPVGFHIVKVVEREYEGVRPFDIKVQNECRDRLRRQYREIEYKKLIEDLWRKGTVDIYDVS
jgi:parvulin-like peptidyl-prolyl isomerase